MSTPKGKFGKAIEVLLWIAALGVLAENLSLFRQNQRLTEALAPQITAGTQLQMLSGLALDGRVQPVSLPAAGSKLLIITFSPGCPACQANQEGWMRLASTLEQKGVRVRRWRWRGWWESWYTRRHVHADGDRYLGELVT